MQSIVEELKENCIPGENIVYINLDKRGYKSVKEQDQLERLIEEKCIALIKGGRKGNIICK